MRRVAQLCWIYLLFFSGALRWARRGLCKSRATVVLVLHRVLREPEYSETSSPRGMVLRESTFQAMACYLEGRCEAVDISQGWIGQACRSGRVRVAVTFDDGWKDTATEVLPVASRHRIPLLVFACSGLDGRRAPFWPEQAVRWWKRSRRTGQRDVTIDFASPDLFVGHLKRLSLADRTEILARALPEDTESEEEPCNSTLDWNELRALQGQRVAVGSHTSSHPLLTQVGADQVERELQDSRQELERQLGRPCLLFAYPNGDWNHGVRQQVQSAGYRWAFTTKPGGWTESSDPLLIPRVNVHEGKATGISGKFSRAAFEYSVFWKAARAMRARAE